VVLTVPVKSGRILPQAILLVQGSMGHTEGVIHHTKLDVSVDTSTSSLGECESFLHILIINLNLDYQPEVTV